MTPDEENAALRAENAALREQVRALLARVQELEGRSWKAGVGRQELEGRSWKSAWPPPSKTATTGASRPPVTDQRRADAGSSGRRIERTKSLREKSGKPSGGQPGHPGHRVRSGSTWSPLPTSCRCIAPCGADRASGTCRRMRRAGSNAGRCMSCPPCASRSPSTALACSLAHVRCPHCGATTQAQAPAGVPAGVPAPRQYGPRLRALCTYLVHQQFLPYARGRELLADLLSAALSVGTLVNPGLNLVQAGAARVQPLADQIGGPDLSQDQGQPAARAGAAP